MAEAITATNPSDVKPCRQCGKISRRNPFQNCCSMRCMNLSRTDHTPETLMRRFWVKVDKAPGFGPDGDCWKWTARIDGRGYGEIKVAGKYKKAHRLALFGPLDMSNPHFACHRCDNPQCVRPDHLFPGLAVDNVRDMIAKGRKTDLRGRTFRRKAA